MPSLVRSCSTKTRGKMCTHETLKNKEFIVVTKKVRGGGISVPNLMRKDTVVQKMLFRRA